MSTEENASITGDLCLGKYPPSLARLPRMVESMRGVRREPIVVNSSWFDLTMLGYLAILLRSCTKPEASLMLRFEDDQKYSFLWRSGFFGASRVGHRNSPFNVEPDIWRLRPDDTGIRANFTPLIVLEVDPDHKTPTKVSGYSETARDAAHSILLELEKTRIYSLVEHSDLMESREYLHVVLWELVQNVIDHAGATHAIIAAQVFYKGDGNGDRALSGLRTQHYLEEEHCELPLRKAWLKENRENNYLMLTCVDNGIGIPVSIRAKKDLREQHDNELLGSSFEREFSDHDTFEHGYRIHGLHLIAQLVSLYHGYLFAQSGSAFIEATQQPAPPSIISEEMALPGAAFQLLLPLTAGEPRPFVEPRRAPVGARTGFNVIYATEELRKRTIRLPPSGKDQELAVDGLVRIASQKSGTLFLDFVGMPRERHFASLLLLCVRRKKTDYPVIVLNASEELFTAIHGLRIPGSGMPRDGELQQIDRALATELTRGDEGPTLLPLIVAVTRLREASQSRSDGNLSHPGIAIQWLGLADDGPYGLESRSVMLLDELFRAEGAVDEFFLDGLMTRTGKPEGTARTLLRNIQRVNPNLLFYSFETREWRLAFNGSSLYFDSVESLTQRLRDAIYSAKFKVTNAGTIFFLNWRRTDLYLRNFYQLWLVVRDPELARIAATLLLRLAHDDPTIGPELSQLRALVSVTASAGLLAREIARILRIAHWEAASVYDLNRAEWPRDFAGEKVLIIDDLIDTGTSSRMLIEELTKRRKANCAGVLSVLASVEGRQARKSLAAPIVSLIEVALGRPTPAEIAEAEANGNVLDVDPHTLEPSSRNRFADLSGGRQTAKQDLSQLARYGGLRSGHFVYGGHHYYEFFDIVRFMDVREGFEDLWTWFKASVNQWHSRTVAPAGGKDAPVAIVYPYYSPISAFLHRIQALLPETFPFPCSIRVACPYQRSKQRVGYRLDSLTVKDRFAVFIDDGIASGGTLSEIVDEFVSIHNSAKPKPTQSVKLSAEGTSQSRAAILALPVFDRIGMNPRKHLKSIDWYHGSVRFEFEPRYSLNLRAYYAKDCPLCRIESDIDFTFRTYEHIKQQLEANLIPVRRLLRPIYLTSVATCAPSSDMGLLSHDDTATVVNASDALFSDLASGSDIKRSIQSDPRKSGMARLEILLNVMMDPILYRSVQEEAFFTKTINNELWRGSVLSQYRSYFLMHMPYLHSADLARRILLDTIPRSLRAKSEPIEFHQTEGVGHQTVTRYFNEHPDVFACIVMAIWILRVREQEKLPEGWDAEWRQTLRETPYRHQFACGTSETKEAVARAFAEMLLCNFVTHYKDHREAFPKRLTDFKNQLPRDRTNPFPKHSLTYLVNAIEAVQDHYDLEDGLLSSDITAEMQALYDAWLLAKDDGAGNRLRALLVKHFTPEQTIHESTITRQLRNGLVPTTDELIGEAKAQLETFAHEHIPPGASEEQIREAKRFISSHVGAITFNNEVMSVHVFGNAHFLVQTVGHLLRNALESAGRNTPFGDEKRPEIVLSAKRSTHKGRDAVRLAVASEEKLTQEQIDRCFRAGGGLMAQKQVIETWGGKMGGHPTDAGRTEFFIELEVVDVAKRGIL